VPKESLFYLIILSIFVAIKGGKITNVALMGAGRMGKVRANAISRNTNAELCCIIDSCEEIGQAFAYEFRVPYFRTLEEALEKQDFEAVWISTPTFAHKECIKTACKHKKHVAVEKPVASTPEDVEECFDCAEKYGVHLFCSFQRRFDPSYVKLREAAWNGDIGRIEAINVVFRDHPGAPVEYIKQTDIFEDLSIHDIDYVLQLLKNDTPTQVYATASSVNEELKAVSKADFATIIIEFKSGAICTLQFHFKCTYGYDQRIEVFGDKGMLQLKNQHATSVEIATKDGIRADCYKFSFPKDLTRHFHKKWIASWILLMV